MQRRFLSSAQPKQGKDGVGFDELRQDGSGNAQECSECFFVLSHPKEGLRPGIQRLRVAGVDRERDGGVLKGFLEKAHVDVDACEASVVRTLRYRARNTDS